MAAISVMAATEQEMDDLVGRLGTLRERLDALVKRNGELEDKDRLQRAEINRCNNTIEQLQRAKRDLTGEIEATRGVMENRGRLIENLNKTNSALSHRVEELEATVLAMPAPSLIVINVQSADDPEPAEAERVRVMCPQSRRECYGPRCKFHCDWHPSGCLLAVEGWNAAQALRLGRCRMVPA